MKLNCKSCGQGHFIPDERIAAAGPGGLKVRCTSCRAIMAVDGSIRKMTGEDTMPDLPTLKRRQGATDLAPALAGGGLPELTGLRRIDEEPVPLPAVMSGGQLQAMPGVSRHLTGVHLPRPQLLHHKLLKRKAERRVWFAAVGGKPRGPFSMREMAELAQRGRVRGRTRVWRPGFAGWVRVRNGADEEETLAWLRDIVIERKRTERQAAQRAQENFGVKMMKLDAPRFEEPESSTPPPLPADAFLDAEGVPEGILADLPPAYAEHDVVRSPTPVLAPLMEQEWSPSEHRAAYGQSQRSRKLLALGLWGVLLAVLASYTAPTMLALHSTVVGLLP